MTLPLRPCVGIALVNRDGFLFAGQRHDNLADAWQMPQGGIDPGESPYDAAIRELREETGVRPRDAQFLAESGAWLDYDLPPELLGRIWNGRYRGQTQRWFLFRLLAGDDAIDIDTHETREFRSWDWLPPSVLLNKVVPFKRHVYRHVFDEFAPWLGQSASPVGAAPTPASAFARPQTDRDPESAPRRVVETD